MSEPVTENEEFTAAELRAALKRMGNDARVRAFAAGLPVVILKGKSVVEVYSDGREVVLTQAGHSLDGARTSG